MQFLIPLFVAMLAFSAPAAACEKNGPTNTILGPVTGCPTLAYDGVDNGVVTTGGFWTNGLLHLFVFEGDHPEPYGSATVQVPISLFPPAKDGNMERPLCQAKLDWTDDDYTGGFDNSQDALLGSVISMYDRANWRETFKWYLTSPPHPHAAFSIIISCPPKAGQSRAPLP